MACTPSHCNEHGTGTQTCKGHRAQCPSNNTFSSSSVAPVGGTILASDIESLRQKIITEFIAYNNWKAQNSSVGGNSYPPVSGVDPGLFYAGSAGGGRLISASNDINVLEQDVYNLNGSLFPNGTSYQNLAGQTTDAATPAKSTYYQGNIIYGIDWTQLVAKYNVAAHDCICNSDCACNNVCACHNDCGCNYSDERLKKNIQFVENKQGLNLYSYNYIWDSATTYIGIMAQQLIGTKYESALSKDNKGYYMVDYSKLPVAMSVSA